MFPWTQLRLDLVGIAAALSDRLAEIKSEVVSVDCRGDVMALQTNLAGLTERLATFARQLDLFPTFPPELASRIEAVELNVERQTHAISEGIERTARAERRIGQTIARARKELKSRGFTDPGLEAEDRELHLVDGERSEAGGLQPVPPEVGVPEQEASSVEGVTVAQLRRARGF